MHELLPSAPEIRIAQKPGRLGAKAFDAVDQLILFLPKRLNAELWRGIPQGARLKAALAKRPGDDVPALQTRLANARQTQVVATTVATDTTTFELLTQSRKLVAAALGEKAGTLGICVAGFDAAQQQAICKAACAAALAAGFSLPSYKKKPAAARIRRIQVLGLDDTVDLLRIIAEARGNNLARWLTVLPPNKLNADSYAALLRDLAVQHGWQFKRYTSKELQKLGAGAFLAVAQGNDNDSASIVRLRYRPAAKSARPDLSLVGKGIIFDTGGTNLKPFAAMLDMHGDMQGSAVALGTLQAISELNLPMAVDCWLAITENRTGPNAYKSQDIVTAANGMTIQTIHTDAEGRMVLADTLTLASREKPRLMIDYATLTGSVVQRHHHTLQRRIYESRQVASAPEAQRRGLRRTRLAVSDRQGIPGRPQERGRRHHAVLAESRGRPYPGGQFSCRVRRTRHALGARRSRREQSQGWPRTHADGGHGFRRALHDEPVARRTTHAG